ncbi:substrate-binding domain-containing protein [Desulfopila sp. IMCC35008]|uniref:substrate-binding domain-containing protein n=1 Tax=Desulfopila sp. IMCC35008 TaxID=2653858 RepID=UPI0013D370A1|nr:substrate-binding domain-containing protein [Desulfopila sp. IMCC35008]
MVQLVRIYVLHLILSFCTATAIYAKHEVLVIPKGEKATFWALVSEGAMKAGRTLGVEVTVRAPFSENHHDAQLHIIEYGIKQKVDAIVLAPNHESATAPALKHAVEKGIKVVLVDSDMTSSYHTCVIASNNAIAGKMAADHLAALIGNSGKVILARHIKGHASTQKREQSFLETLVSEYPQIQVVADPYVGASMGEAYRTMSYLLRDQPDVKGIFSVGEEASLGILRALNEGRYTSEIKFIGFDFNVTVREALFSNGMDATILQNPFQMGYMGVEIANRLILEEKVEPLLYTDMLLVSKENMFTPEVQRIIRYYLEPKE